MIWCGRNVGQTLWGLGVGMVIHKECNHLPRVTCKTTSAWLVVMPPKNQSTRSTRPFQLSTFAIASGLVTRFFCFFCLRLLFLFFLTVLLLLFQFMLVCLPLPPNKQLSLRSHISDDFWIWFSSIISIKKMISSINYKIAHISKKYFVNVTRFFIDNVLTIFLKK